MAGILAGSSTEVYRSSKLGRDALALLEILDDARWAAFKKALDHSLSACFEQLTQRAEKTGMKLVVSKQPF